MVSTQWVRAAQGIARLVPIALLCGCAAAANPDHGINLGAGNAILPIADKIDEIKTEQQIAKVERRDTYSSEKWGVVFLGVTQIILMVLSSIDRRWYHSKDKRRDMGAADRRPGLDARELGESLAMLASHFQEENKHAHRQTVQGKKQSRDRHQRRPD